MGYSRTDEGAWKGYAKQTSHRSARDFNQAPTAAMSAANFKRRESRKSPLSPNPTPIALALDLTGSMSDIAEDCRKSLGQIFADLIERHAVEDPHVLVMGVGDVFVDRDPIQVSEFEADAVVLGKQVEKLTNQNGGGNGRESYLLPLLVATRKVDCDAFLEGRRGFIFTVGDDGPEMQMSAHDIAQFIGSAETGVTVAELISEVSRNWHYFHVVVMDGQTGSDRVLQAWRSVLGERAIELGDHRRLAELVVSLIEVVSGADAQTVSARDPVIGKALRGVKQMALPAPSPAA